MAIRCANCDHELPRADARFCSYCGATNPSQPQSQSPSQPVPSRPAAPQAPSAEKASPDANVTPWLGFDGPLGQNATPWFGFEGQITPAAPETPADPVDKASSPEQPALRSVVPSRPEVSPGGDNPAGRTQSPTHAEGTFPGQRNRNRRVHTNSADVPSLPEQDALRSPEQDVEDMPTRQVPKEQVEDIPTRQVLKANVEDMPTRQVPKEHVEPPSVTPVAPGATKAVTPRPTRSHSSKRTPLVAILALVAVLIVVGVAAIAMLNPFGPSVDIAPMQTVQNSTLGVTLSDPAGWKQHMSGNVWTLSDSTNTAQMTITQSASTSPDLATYLNKQATQMGMSNAKAGAPVTFAGVSWSQIRGDYLNQGATYTGTLYAVIHNGHLYTLTQVSPKVIFTDEDRLVFAPARTSFQFKP